MKIYSIRDSKAQASNEPFFSPTRATAMRLMMSRMDKDENLRRFAADFDLMEIGTWQADHGEITAQEPHHVTNLYDILEEKHKVKNDTHERVSLPASNLGVA